MAKITLNPSVKFIQGQVGDEIVVLAEGAAVGVCGGYGRCFSGHGHGAGDG